MKIQWHTPNARLNLLTADRVKLALRQLDRAIGEDTSWNRPSPRAWHVAEIWLNNMLHEVHELAPSCL